MNIDNGSYQSFARPTSRAVDITDLREALDGRSVIGGEQTNSTAPPSIVSTIGAQTLAGDPVKKKNPDVKEVLREIFKDKKRGTGKNSGNGLGGKRSTFGRKASEIEMMNVNDGSRDGNGNANGTEGHGSAVDGANLNQLNEKINGDAAEKTNGLLGSNLALGPKVQV